MLSLPLLEFYMLTVNPRTRPWPRPRGLATLWDCALIIPRWEELGIEAEDMTADSSA